MSSNIEEKAEAAVTAVTIAVEKKKKLDSRLDAIRKKYTPNVKSLQLKQPEYQAAFENDRVQETINKIEKILGRYTASTITLEQGNKDVITLSALLVNLSIDIGNAQGLSTHFEHNRKTAYAEAFTDIIQIAEEDGLKISNAEAENISRSVSKEATEIAAQAEMTSRVMTYMYYAAKSFVDILNSTLNRMSRENSL
jgi:hypothetical protein